MQIIDFLKQYIFGISMQSQKDYEKFGLNRNELYGSYSSAQKIAYEQVLLLLIYSRQVYFSSEWNLLHQRIKLVHTLAESKFNKLKPLVLKLIEKGSSSTEIIKCLLNENEQLTEEFGQENLRSISKSADSLISTLEDKQIAFPKEEIKKHPYSYFSIYKSLKDPFEIFENLLLIDLDIKEMNERVHNLVENYLERKMLPLPPGAKIKNPNIVFELFDEGKITIDDHKEINTFVRSNLLEKLSISVRNIFSLIRDYNYWKDNKQNFNLKSPLTEISKISSKDDELCLHFEKYILKDLMNLGQIDSIMAGIKEKIVEELKTNDVSIRGEIKLKEQENNSIALKELELWHKKQPVKLIKKIDQIPKLIASIIEFDIRNQLGFCDRDFGSCILFPIFRHKKISMQETYFITTNLIKRCLYETSGLDSYKKTLGSLSVEDFTSERVLNDDIFFYENNMMSIWANEDVNAITERFKKLPPYLKGNTTNFVSNIINKQKEANTPNIYPINSSFPLPLWIKSLKPTD